jgi:hypothetical protein
VDQLFHIYRVRYFTFYFIFLILAACNNSSDHDGSSNADTINTIENNASAHMDYSGCYRQVIARDTILLQLVQNNDQFRGKMEFDNFEKDASHGLVKGHTEKGNIVLWYDFTSEGMQSVMEVILKPDSSQMIRAVSDIRNRGDTVLLQHDKLNFDPSNALTRIDCAEWH